MDLRSKQLKLPEILMMKKALLNSYTLKLMVKALTKVKKRPTVVLELLQLREKNGMSEEDIWQFDYPQP